MIIDNKAILKNKKDNNDNKSLKPIVLLFWNIIFYKIEKKLIIQNEEENIISLNNHDEVRKN